ncbi:MAG: HepT-like ribonuclease domain-containing protein [Acidobacteriota bacterium]
MKEIPLNKHTITSKLDEIQRDVEKLKKFQSISYEEFKEGENFAIAEHYLRRALEALFEIGAHILSKIPGARITSYREIAKNLGQYKIVLREFFRRNID